MIARVFPRRTNATPDDQYAFVGEPPFIVPEEITEVHISVTFSWDIAEGDRLKRSWEKTGKKVKIGGPALGSRGEEFVPGKYLKPGYVITSRGCPNACWFCSVPKREGKLREIPITYGNNVLDDNFLACSEEHMIQVFSMLKKQKGPKEFTGGLEANRLEPWQAISLRALRAKQVFFAYDSPEKFQHLEKAVELMFSAGFTKASKSIRSYVLVGFPGDTFEKAESRLNQCLSIGCFPMAMVFRDEKGIKNPAWGQLQRKYARPAIMKICQENQIVLS